MLVARSSRVELAIAAVTVACVVIVGVLQAIIVAVVLLVADIIRRAARPADAVLGWSTEDDRYVDVVDHPDAGVTPSVVVYRIQDRLFFANDLTDAIGTDHVHVTDTAAVAVDAYTPATGTTVP